MVSERKLASAVGGKTARACDSCIKKRARWYCAADDAFLCQACDSSVHSANQLARRHERVRLKTASTEESSDEPSWHHGIQRKPRTPRKSNKLPGEKRDPVCLVPELGPEESLIEENDGHEQLLYCVPIFDPFAAQLCVLGTLNDDKKGIANDVQNYKDSKYLSRTVNYDCEGRKNLNSDLQGFSQSNKDLEFAADVENLLRKGLDGESFDMETLGFLDCGEKDSLESPRSTGAVKLEDHDDRYAVMGNYAEIGIGGETFELNMDDYDSPGNSEDGGTGTSVNLDNEDSGEGNGDDVKPKKNILLALDYEAVIAAWADQKSPWMNGDRPQIDPDDCMDVCGGIHYLPCGDNGDRNTGTGMLDGGREARVLRYREKRQRRLFSKRIRYEVRKLNAEKRPRVKGRFVKTESLAANSLSFSVIPN